MGQGHDRASELSAPASSGVDVLSDVLRTVRMTGALFFPLEATSPWVDEIPTAAAFAGAILPGAQHVVSYHIVRRGACWAALVGGPPVHLHTHDILVIPHGDAYLMSSAPGLRPEASADAVLAFFRQMGMASAPTFVAEGGGGPDRVDVVCGFLGCDIRPFNPLLASLPRLVHLRPAAASGHNRLAPLLDFALAESHDRRSGAKCVLLRLSEVLFVEVIRQYLETLPAGHTGWLAGSRDAVVGRALVQLHDRPADAWSLERLARAVGTSRSALAERFAHFVGQPPMRYLTQWRMQLAARLLSDGTAKVSSVALDVGYESEAAFSRAFKKMVGTSPAAWRRGLTGGEAPGAEGGADHLG